MIEFNFDRETLDDLNFRFNADLYFIDYGESVFQKGSDDLRGEESIYYAFKSASISDSCYNGGSVLWVYMTESAYEMMEG